MIESNNYLKYHLSIAQEIRDTQNRIRDLIGSKHWPTDGAHKEAVLKKVLRAYLPETFNIGSGFICYEESVSTQLDIIIFEKKYPTLFKDGDLYIVTPECVRAVIEVKTSPSSSELKKAIHTLCKQAEKNRRTGNNCLVGLFMFEKCSTINNILNKLHIFSKSKMERVIDLVSVGPRHFIRFWKEMESVKENYSYCQSYNFTNEDGVDLEGLSYSYFISNIAMSIIKNTSSSTFAWYPLKNELGKEMFKEQRKDF